MTDKIDREIIKRLVVDDKLIGFDDLGWLNCILHNAEMNEFKTQGEYDKAIKTDDDFLLIFLLINSFERMGFDSKLDKCKCNCPWSQKDNKTKSHPVSVLLALGDIKKDRGANDFNTLLKKESIESLANEWFQKSVQRHKSKFPERGFNQRGFNSKHLTSFLQFFNGGETAKLGDKISGSNFKAAYDLLVKARTGMGPKIAKYIVRSLAFSLTNWGTQEGFPASVDPKELPYAIPIDRWVRRVSIAIPTIHTMLRNNLSPSDLSDDNLSDSVDKQLSHIITNVCQESNLNPLRFDLGAFMFGANIGAMEIKRKRKVPPPVEIYRKLQDWLISTGAAQV